MYWEASGDKKRKERDILVIYAQMAEKDFLIMENW